LHLLFKKKQLIIAFKTVTIISQTYHLSLLLNIKSILYFNWSLRNI